MAELNTKGLALYHFQGCPYCQRVRDAIDRLGLEIGRRDIQLDPSYREELFAATGRTTVPCLRIEDASGSVQWMHESSDIISYLEKLPQN